MIKVRKQNSSQIFRALSLVTTIGINMVVSILVGLYIGRYLDGYFGTAPWITIVGLLLGVAAAIVGTYRLIMTTMKDEE